ncbi:hypothetical protein C9E82_22475 [Paracoccus siganidrum]|nr:hypothetical protein C9E82_22475 [Paracoccus siganidrum]
MSEREGCCGSIVARLIVGTALRFIVKSVDGVSQLDHDAGMWRGSANQPFVLAAKFRSRSTKLRYDLLARR